jgi:hypothetical protein
MQNAKDEIMGRSISAKNGNDNINTPLYLAKEIVDHYKPEGKILEPCIGDGNFLKVLPSTTDWCEINKGRDFLTTTGHWDWIITNPPYSKYRLFLRHAMEVADNIVFLQLINATFYKARLKDIKDMGFGIKEIWCLETPKEFPQFGFQLGCVYYKKEYSGCINFI